MNREQFENLLNLLEGLSVTQEYSNGGGASTILLSNITPEEFNEIKQYMNMCFQEIYGLRSGQI